MVTECSSNPVRAAINFMIYAAKNVTFTLDSFTMGTYKDLYYFDKSYIRLTEPGTYTMNNETQSENSCNIRFWN